MLIFQFGTTPLALAASKGNLYTLQLLLHYGANSNLKDFRNTSPLKCAFEAKRYDIIPALATAGAYVDETCLVSQVYFPQGKIIYNSDMIFVEYLF